MSKTNQARPRAVLQEGKKQADQPTADDLKAFDEIVPEAAAAIQAGEIEMEDAVSEITSRLKSLNPEDVKTRLLAEIGETSDEAEGDEPSGAASDPATSPSSKSKEGPVAAPQAPEKLPTLSKFPDAIEKAQKRTAALRAAGAALDEDLEMVIVEVPKAFKLRVSNDLIVDIAAGAQKLERFLAKHWYAVANKVRIVE